MAYENSRKPHATKSDLPPLPSRPQGSLYSQQKHKIADAIEWMRLNATHKPRIFVCTTPGLIEYAKESHAISSFTTNLRNNYHMVNYCWVRELTKRGYPHYHFIADIPKFDPVHVSKYWSRFFGVEAVNSIRLGTRPTKDGRRKFWVDNQKMSWYMSKYIGKGLSDAEIQLRDSGKRFRTFAISQEATQKSQPLIYESEIHHTWSNTHVRTFTICDEQAEPGVPGTFTPQGYDWKWTGHGHCYTGFPKRSDRQKQRSR